MSGIQIPPGRVPPTSFAGIALNVKPNEQCPGKSVEIIATMLKALGLATGVVEQKSGYGASWFEAVLKSLQFTASHVCYWVLDYAFEGETSVGETDNMFIIRTTESSNTEGWILSYLSLNGANPTLCRCSDGSVDITSPICVGWKFNIRSW